MKIFEDIPVGSYTIKVSAGGFKSAEKVTQLKIDQVLSERFELEEGSDIDFGIEMVFVKGDTFTMGCTDEQDNDCSDREKPTRQVTVSDFYIGKYEITQKQWREIMGNSPSQFSGCDNCPVENVSWIDVQEFIKKLNKKIGKKYRLPSEAEWEYAARSGSHSMGYKYAGGNVSSDIAWYDSKTNVGFDDIYDRSQNNIKSKSKPQPIGGKAPNEIGIYDMSGNVWEWCEDDWHKNYKDAPTDEQAWIDKPRFRSRVVRGGSWNVTSEFCRVAVRHKLNANKSSASLGFRLAHDF
jgi:formylglycine-generating enzyme